MQSTFITITAACALALATPTIFHAAERPTQAAHGGHDHGGLLEIGNHAAFLKVDRDEASGNISIVVFGPDGKTPLAIAEAPRVNLMSQGKRVQVVLTATNAAADGSASVFSATSDSLKGHIHGAIRIKIGENSYQVGLPDPHH